MGTEARRTSIKKVRAMRLLGVLLAILLPFLISTYCFSDSDRPPDYFDEWLNTLRKGETKEKIFALLRTPSFLDCCQYEKNPEVFNLVLNALEDKDPSIREAAAACLKERVDRYSMKCCQQIKIVPSLIKTLEDSNARVRQEAAKALAYYKDERAIDSLIKRLGDKDPWVRLHIVFALGELRALNAVDPLLNLLEDDSDWRNKFVQQECVKAIRKIGTLMAIGLGGGVTRITPETRRPDGNIVTPGATRQMAPGRPTKIGGFDDETTAKVISVLIRKSDDPYLRLLIMGAFVQFKTVEAREILLKAKEDPNEEIRKLALDGLLQISALQPREDLRIRIEPGKKYTEDMLDILKKSMKDSSPKVRADAVAALGKSGDERAVDLLIEALRDSDRTVTKNAIEGLGQFRDEKILDDMLSFFGKRESYSDDLDQLAVKTFMSVAEKTTKEWVFIHRRDGIRYVSKNTFGISREAKISRHMVHPTAVGKLLDFFNRANPREKLEVLTLFRSFEDERIKGVLLQLLDDPSPEMRSRAISRVPYFFDNSMVPRMIDALKDKDSRVRAEVVRTLGEFEDRRALDPLITGLSDNSPSVREAAIRVLILKSYEDSRISDSVIGLLNDPSTLVRSAAVVYFREKPDKRAVEALIPLLSDKNTDIASISAQALAKIGDAKAVDPLIKVVRSEYDRERMLDIYLRNSAIIALGQIKDKKATPVIIDALQKKELRISAVIALRTLKDNRAVPVLIKCLSDDDPYVRRLAASALRDIGDPAGLEAVKDIPGDKPPPAVGGANALAPRVLKPPPPSIRKDSIPVPGSGYSVTMFGRQEKKEEKPPPPKEEKPETTPPPARVVSKYDSKPRPSVDIKPLLPKLKANDPKVRREATDNLGDAGNQEATDHLIPLLKDKDEYVRQAAARALGKLKDKKAVEALTVSLQDPDVNVKAFSAWALGEIQDTRAIEPLCNSLFDKEQKVRDQSFEALRKFREPMSRTTMVNTLMKNAKGQSSAELMLSKLISSEGKEVILKAYEDPDGDNKKTIRNYIDLMEKSPSRVSDIATKALENFPDRGMVISELSSYIHSGKGTPARSISFLGSLKDPRALPILLSVLREREDSYFRETVIRAIGELGDKEAIEPLLRILVDDKEHLNSRVATARALKKFGDIKTVEPLLQILRNEKEHKELRIAAADALGAIKDKRPVELLIKILVDNNEDNWLRIAAASSLGNIGDERAIAPLETALKDAPDYLRHAVEIALRKLKTGK